MRNWFDEFKGLTWTLAGTAMVLITLSGTTLRRGLLITLIALALYFVFAVLTDTGEKDD